MNQQYRVSDSGRVRGFRAAALGCVGALLPMRANNEGVCEPSDLIGSLSLYAFHLSHIHRALHLV